MSQQQQTWRDLLRNMEGGEKRRIIEALGIQEKTWERWIYGQTVLPHPNRIQQLLAVLPVSTRASFLVSLRQDPNFSKSVAHLQLYEWKKGISSIFYSHVLRANMIIPEPVRFITLCQLILLEIVGHFDPDQQGLSVAILTCTPPGLEKSVRTLNQRFALGTPPWSKVLQQPRFFLGTKSLAGNAVVAQDAKVWQSIHRPQDDVLWSVYQNEHIASSAAVPILKQRRSGGCLFLLSTQPDFFTSTRIATIQRYCELLVIALRDDEWYEAEQFNLQVMPPASIQQTYFVRFDQQVATRCKQQVRDGWPVNWLEAERMVLQQVEAELISHEMIRDTAL